MKSAKPNRMTLALLVLIAISGGNLMRTHGLADVRGVDAVQILALGMLLGGLAASVIVQRKVRG